MAELPTDLLILPKELPKDLFIFPWEFPKDSRRLSFLLSFPCLTFSYTFCPSSSHQPGSPSTFFYFFQLACLAPFLFINFQLFSSSCLACMRFGVRDRLHNFWVAALKA